jgi:8-oxo-dGTP pyrophosphatase MutT (NUDIX family)
MNKQFILSIANWGYRGLQKMINAATLGARGIVINNDNEILLVEHTYTNGWHLPGGGVDYGESPSCAVIREIKEETGYKVTGTPELLGIYTSSVRGAADYPIIYVIKDFEPIPNARKSFEISRFDWFPIENLPEEIQPATKLRILEYLENKPTSEFW